MKSKSISRFDSFKATRGYKNNNPFNIKLNPANKWHGAKPLSENTDGTFEEFYHIEFGIRAAIILIKNYIKDGFCTPKMIIERFAPASENNISAYLFFLTTGTPFDEDDVIIPFSDNFYLLLHFIALFESNFDKPLSFYKSISKLFNLH